MGGKGEVGGGGLGWHWTRVKDPSTPTRIHLKNWVGGRGAVVGLALNTYPLLLEAIKDRVEGSAGGREERGGR